MNDQQSLNMVCRYLNPNLGRNINWSARLFLIGCGQYEGMQSGV